MPHIPAPNIKLYETGVPPLTKSLISVIKTLKTRIHLNCIRKFGPCHHGIARPRVADEGTASEYGG
jgi:hypothetical protein